MATLRASVATELDSKELQAERQGSYHNVQETQPDHSQTMDTSLEDGYSWRKYGQKHVKGIAFPRCYYKCKYPNCHVKKHFECSNDGKIADIVYKGMHDHPKTHSRHRTSIGSTTSVQQEKVDRLSCFKVEGKPRKFLFNIYGQTDKLSLASFYCIRMFANKSSNSHVGNIDGKDAANVGNIDGKNAANVGNVDGEGAALEGRGDEDDNPESKQRKRKIEDIQVSRMDKPIREPRVVVQTPSEVDILDDGYRWRKYGQKAVKGNPNPRSYYRCTNPRCAVRKHVERAWNDRKEVITTYEGKHNHDVPSSSARITSKENEKLCPAVHVSASKDMLTTERKDAISLHLSVGLTSTPANTTIN